MNRILSSVNSSIRQKFGLGAIDKSTISHRYHRKKSIMNCGKFQIIVASKRRIFLVFGDMKNFKLGYSLIFFSTCVRKVLIWVQKVALFRTKFTSRPQNGFDNNVNAKK